MKPGRFSWAKRADSFKYAFNGLKILLQEEHNARLHLFTTFCVFVAGILLKNSATDWVAIVFAVGFVLVTEIINTSVENLSDFVSPEKNEKIRRIKDLSAAAVLISTVAALFTGLIIFIPEILELLNQLTRR